LALGKTCEGLVIAWPVLVSIAGTTLPDEPTPGPAPKFTTQGFE
jgi:hypothetical protein